MVPPLVAQSSRSFLLLVALVVMASCSGANGGGTPSDRTLVTEGRRLDAPGEVTDCRPCTVAIEPGTTATPWTFTFDVVEESSGGGRVVRRVAVRPPGWSADAPTLEVQDMTPVPPGQTFFFGPQDLDFDGRADLLLATDRGVANTYARYWRYDPTAMSFVDLGTFPVLTVDSSTRQITSYERGGMGGLAYTRAEYAWRDQQLEPVRVEEQTPAEQPGEMRRVVRERRGNALVTVEEQIIRVP